MRTSIAILLMAATAAGCGGGAENPAESPLPGQSPGGHWYALHQNSQVHFYISETGTVRAVIETGVTTGPMLGTGSVGVAASGAVSGSMQASGFPPSDVFGCSLSGTLEERVSLELQVTCSDNAGIVYDEDISMTPEADYGTGSSLTDIAGNYTLSISAGPNSLNIAADGTIFGMWDSGDQCTVSGRVSIIDPDYNLYDVEWQFSDCTGPFGQFDGAELTGFATEESEPSWPDGSYFFILTGTGDNGFTAVVRTYVPF